MSPKLRSLLGTNKGQSTPKLVGQAQVAPAGGSAPQFLNFSMEVQTQTNWCWAATAKSVSHFYNRRSRWTQCLVAQQAFQLLQCPCNNPSPCNQTWFLDQALSITSNFVRLGLALTFAAVEAELIAGKVLGARTGWGGGGGHFLVIHGCRQSAGINYFNVDDPIYGQSDVEEAVFLSRYQGTGTWTHSYYTKR